MKKKIIRDGSGRDIGYKMIYMDELGRVCGSGEEVYYDSKSYKESLKEAEFHQNLSGRTTIGIDEAKNREEGQPGETMPKHIDGKTKKKTKKKKTKKK